MKKDPNNAYGSERDRKKALGVTKDEVVNRDFADIDAYFNSKRPTKMEIMAKDDAMKRFREMESIQGLPTDQRERMRAEDSAKSRKRLIEKYAKEAPASKMPSSAESAASGNRASKENAKDAKAVAATTPRKRPSIAASMESARRVGAQEGDEMRKMGMKHGGAVKKYAKGGVTRADGCAVRGKTKGKMV